MQQLPECVFRVQTCSPVRSGTGNHFLNKQNIVFHVIMMSSLSDLYISLQFLDNWIFIYIFSVCVCLYFL